MRGQGNSGSGRGRGQGGGQGGGMGGGRNKGLNRGPQAAGPNGECVCPSCGAVVPHQQGTPCTSVKCPECGEAMARK